LLEGAKYQVLVISDHKNLEYFTTSRVLSRCLARWSLFLSSFSFIVKHQPGSLNGKADALHEDLTMRNSIDHPLLLSSLYLSLLLLLLLAFWTRCTVLCLKIPLQHSSPNCLAFCRWTRDFSTRATSFMFLLTFVKQSSLLHMIAF